MTDIQEILKQRAWERSTSTKDGVKITVGLRVVDYNRDHGTIVGEAYNAGTEDAPDHWYDVKTDKGTRSTMNAERLYSERNYRKGM